MGARALRSHLLEPLTDVERIAPCLPGAQLQEIEGEEYRGVVKVKVGPITAQYKGAAVFEERDKDNWRVVIKGDGRDTRGAGNASALITAHANQSGATTLRFKGELVRLKEKEIQRRDGLDDDQEVILRLSGGRAEFHAPCAGF